MAIVKDGMEWHKVELVEPPPNTDKACPECGGAMDFGAIPCPEGRIGCLVLHRGYTCRECGAIWRARRIKDE
jgi:transposase